MLKVWGVKALELFRKNKCQCKSCKILLNKAYCAANTEKITAYRKAYREDNKEAFNTYGREYRKANPEACKAYGREYRKANREARKAYGREYRKANREARKAHDRAYRKANPEKVKAAAKACFNDLKDSYVVNALKLTKATATPELIELKRTQLQLIRLTREIKNEQRKSTSSASQ